MRGQNTSSAKSMGRILRLLFYQTKALLDNLCGAIVLITRVPCVKAALPQNRKEQNCRCFNIFFLWGNFLSDLYENCFLPSARILSLTYSLLQIFLFVFRVHIAHLDPAGSEIVADDWISSRGSRLFRHSSHLFLGSPHTRLTLQDSSLDLFCSIWGVFYCYSLRTPFRGHLICRCFESKQTKQKSGTTQNKFGCVVNLRQSGWNAMTRRNPGGRRSQLSFREKGKGGRRGKGGA